MPFRSKKQRSLFHARAARGEISQATVAHWEKETGKKKLPLYAKKRRKKKKARA